MMSHPLLLKQGHEVCHAWVHCGFSIWIADFSFLSLHFVLVTRRAQEFVRYHIFRLEKILSLRYSYFQTVHYHEGLGIIHKVQVKENVEVAKTPKE